MYLVRAPCKKTDRSVGMSLDKYEYIIIIIIIIIIIFCVLVAWPTLRH